MQPSAAPDIRPLLGTAAVMPIITLQDRAHAVGLARALVAGGIRVFEIVLRTSAALHGISDIRAQVPEATVGAGTLVTPQDVRRAVDAGALFGVTPGLTDELAEAAIQQALPLLPGVWTASEVMQALRHGFTTLKLFPAQGLQGAAQIEQLAPVFRQVRFCPTGGIKPEHIPRYLALPACGAVGGSWATPADRIAAQDWDSITALARQAAAFADQRPAPAA